MKPGDQSINFFSRKKWLCENSQRPIAKPRVWTFLKTEE